VGDSSSSGSTYLEAVLWVLSVIFGYDSSCVPDSPTDSGVMSVFIIDELDIEYGTPDFSDENILPID